MGTYAGAGAACAGTGSACGDGSAASSAQLNHPSATLVDEASNLYIADFNSNLVRKVTTQGVISTVAGDGTACSSASATCGDGGAATAANLTPSGIALDGAGNLYIADEGRIRMVNLATGMISTVAGTGAACSSPTAACGDGGSAASAQLNLGAASGLAVDGAGNLLIADSGDNRIRSVALATGVISTVSGTGATCSSSSAACGDGAQAAVAQFNNPTGIAVDASENYLIADTGDNRVRKISALTSSISTVAGNGTQCTSFADCGDGVAATSAQLNAPTGVAADAAGNIYIADTGDNVIRMASVVTNHISTVAGNAVACATDTAACGDGAAAPGASLNLPSGVALDNAGNLYIADANDNRVRQVNVSSPITLNFPNTEVSTTSSAQSVTVENIGNASLSFTAAGVAAPTDYIRGTGSTCADSGTVATGASCTLSIQFSPTTNGLLNEFFMLTDNSLNVTNASQSIAVSGTAGALPTATQEVASTTLTQNHAAMSFTPVTGSGGTGALTYTVSPSLPSGLSMNPATGAIMGTPTGTSSSASYTVTVTDTNGATGTATFSLTVNGAIVASQAVASTSLTESRAAIPFTTVTATGGTGTLTYSVSPALPTGLTFNSATGAITGTPTGTSSLTSYTVTVTDSNGATAAASFNLTVDAAVVASQGVVAASLTENHAAMSFTPVTGAGGTGTLTYSVSPALPAGLSLNAATGAITGTPTGTSSLTIYTVTVTDSNSATAMATFSLTVNASISTTVVVGSEMLTVNSAASFTPITATGGTGALAYSVSPGLPAGLSLNAVTGAITGTPTGTSALASYTVTVTDANGSTATASFSLQVQWMQPVVAITAPGASMTYGTALGIGATATYNSSAVAGSFSYTAMPAGGVAHIVTAATVLPAGSYTLTARFAPANAMLYATATQTALLTVSQATTAVSVSTSMNPSVLQNPITITAMVNAQATGSVSFMSGTTPLGSGAVSGGVATLITSSLPAGSQSIVAVYGGDSNFVAATSAASSQMVLDFGVNTGSASGAGSSGSGMAQTVAPGKAATYMLAITPTAGTQLPLATVLSVSGLPSGATASLSNAAWTQLSSTSWSLPSNTPIGNVALTFQIPSETASAAKKDAPMHPLSPVLLGVLFLPFAAAMRRRGRCLGRSLSLLLLLVAGTVGMTGLTGCGTSGGFFGQAQATYNVTVTVTTGTLSHSTNLTLTVE
jgi:uncharacterized protein YjiK/stress response protein SCP2